METVPNTFESLFWGYSAIWVLLCFYFVILAKRLRKAERDLYNR